MTTAPQLEQLLELRTAPVAIAFLASPPAGVSRFDGAAPSSCSYWRSAAEGKVFYTEAADHLGCPVGAYTHGIDLPPGTAKELEGVVGMMIDLGYLGADEVATIPRRENGFGVAVYAPLASAPCEPDVVLIRGNARQMMLLAEAARAAGVGGEGGLMGRPTCAAIPQVMRIEQSVASLGCIGNRVYTGLTDDELYAVLPGRQIRSVVEKLVGIVRANRELESFHRARQGA
jgi:uncharacterized protein (DUF169 family)